MKSLIRPSTKGAMSLLIMALAAAPAMAVPNLRLNVQGGGTTFAPGDSVIVTLDVDTIAPLDAINGVQALMHYDNTLLSLVGIVATTDISGDGAATADDWTEAVNIDSSGDLTYVVVINASGVSTALDHTIATLTFSAIAEGSTSVVFRADSPPQFTKLTRASDNGAILPVKFGTPLVTLTCDDGNVCTTDAVVAQACTHTNNTASCDDGVFCNGADTCSAGSCAVHAGDPCVGGPECANSCDEIGGTCNVASGTACTSDGNVCTDNVCDGAGTCAAVNNTAACDDLNPCTMSDVCSGGLCSGTDPAPQITVGLAIDHLAPAVSVARDVSFVITTCGFAPDVRNSLVTFDGTGFGTTLLSNVDPSAAWISVREGHTLSRLAAVLPDACGDTVVDLTGATTLVSGDLQNVGGTALQDDIVDVTDFSILASNWNQMIDPALSAGADVDADGVQDMVDFTALQMNFFKVSDAVDGCVPLPQGGDFGFGSSAKTMARAFQAGVTRISVDRLSIPNADRADVNRDGVVDVKDIRAFASKFDLPLLPEFELKLNLIEEMQRIQDSRSGVR